MKTEYMGMIPNETTLHWGLVGKEVIKVTVTPSTNHTFTLEYRQWGLHCKEKWTNI